MSEKLLTLDNLRAVADGHRAAGRRLVLCNGAFDLLHIGHIRHLNEARRLGDRLLVTVTVTAGQEPPSLFDPHLRAEALASLACVDHVAINPYDTLQDLLAALRPDVFAQSAEEVNGGGSTAIRRCCEQLGVAWAQTGEVQFQSTQRISRFMSDFPLELEQYLRLFRRRHRAEDVVAWLQRMADLRVLIVGDTILDGYHYCHTLGVSSKDPVLVAQLDSSDMFAGGVLAAANHLAGFAGAVTLGTVLGQRERHETFIRQALAPAIRPTFFTQADAPTLIKRRYIEGYCFTKLFEVYVMDDRGLDPVEERRFCDWLEAGLADHDLVVVTDFGHGAIGPAARGLLMEKAPFLAVNAQANSGNRGFHTIGRYGRADFVSLAEHELKLEMRDMQAPIKASLAKIGRDLGCRAAVVTRGKKGCVVHRPDSRPVEVPAFAQKVVDRIGAGDAFFAVTALAACLGAPAELLGFIGNVVGALAVEIIGNQQPVGRPGAEALIHRLLQEV